MSLEALQTTLYQRHQQQSGLRVVIKADTQAQHGRVVAVMDTAKAVGIERLAIATASQQTSQ